MASHDTAWKMLFSFPEMVCDLLAGFVPPEWVSDLDLCALTRHSEGQVTDDARERQPAQGHFVLDVGRYTGPLPDGRNWMAALVRLARTPDPEVVAAALCDMSAWWPESNYDSLLDAILSWLGQVHFPMHGIKLEIPKLANVRETVAMLHQVGIDWSAKLRAEGRTEGRTEGRAEGQIAVMRRQADRKFGPEIAERLAERLAEISDPERLGEVGEWILKCNRGDELLARVARLCEAAAAEDCAAQE